MMLLLLAFVSVSTVVIGLQMLVVCLRWTCGERAGGAWVARLRLGFIARWWAYGDTSMQQLTLQTFRALDTEIEKLEEQLRRDTRAATTDYEYVAAYYDSAGRSRPYYQQLQRYHSSKSEAMILWQRQWFARLSSSAPPPPDVAIPPKEG